MSSDPPIGHAYRGRLAPSPTGYLHLGHARTFWTAQQRAKLHRGALVLRNEDLDAARCKPEFVAAMIEDLRWFGFDWQEGPDRGGPFVPYSQSQRGDLYRSALHQLRERGFIYPCTCSRKDIQAAVNAPHAANDELIYPGTCRPKGARCQVSGVRPEAPGRSPDTSHLAPDTLPDTSVSWRFRVPDGQVVSFIDEHLGAKEFVAGRDFGDFVVWRQDDVAAYQLACVVDDAAMRITEVVRGADLLLSTARQLLLYRALELAPPRFYHCPLMLDDSGARLAKRHDTLSLRTLRASGASPESLRSAWSG